MFKEFQVEWGKLALIGFLMFGGFVLIIVALLTNVSDERFAVIVALATACITGPAGYLYGNGRLAAKGEPSIPTLGRSREAALEELVRAYEQQHNGSRLPALPPPPPPR